MESIDLTTFDQDKLAAWLFDRPVSSDPDEAGWYTEYSFDTERPQLMLSTMTLLFQNWRTYSTQFSREQIDGGLWAVCSSASIGVGSYLANAKIPLSIRLALVESIYHLYADVVAFLPTPFVESGYEMCWDLVCTAFWSEVHRAPLIFPTTPEEIDAFLKNAESQMLTSSHTLNKIAQQSQAERASASATARLAHAKRDFSVTLTNDQRAVHDYMFSTLCRILALDNPSCQHAALHGLGHLHHPNVASAVQSYIDREAGNRPPEQREWLEACRDGTVM